MAFAKYTWDDFFNFGDDTPLNKFTSEIDRLNNVYKGFGGAIEKSNERISESLKEYREEAQKLLSTIDKQNIAMDKSGDEMNAAAKQANELFASTRMLREMEEAHKKELDQMRAAIDRLTKARDDSGKKLDAEKNSLADLKKKLKEAEDAYQKMGDATDKAVKSDQLNKIRDLATQYGTASKAVQEARKYTVAAVGSYDHLAKSLNEARRELRSMENGFDDTNPRVRELTKFIQEADQKVKAFDKTLGQNQRNVGNYGEAFEKIAAVGDRALPGLGGEIGNIKGLLSSTTIAAGGLVAGIGAAGKAFYDESVRIRKSLERVNMLTSLTGKELENFTARASSTSKVFDKEFNEVIRAGNVLMKSFGVGGTEAMETINQAFLRGVDIQGDFLEQINEYSTFIAQAGGSTQDLVDILLASEQAGVFSDKGLDTIKEATLRIREMTPATRDAIKGLGLSVDEIEKGLRDGSKSVLDVIRMVTKRMAELPPISTEVGTAIADIFAGPGEDAGQFLFTLGEIEQTQGDWTKELTGSYKAQYELLEATREYETTLISTAGNFEAFSTNFETFFTRVKTVAIGVLAELAGWFTTLDHRVDEFNKSLQQSKDVQVLQQELENLQKQAEDGQTWWQTLADGFVSMGNGAAMATKAGERQTEIQIKIAALQKRIADLMNESTAATETNTEAVTQSSAAAKKLLDAEFALQKFRLEEAIKAQELIAKNEANMMTARVDASLKAEKLRGQLVELERKNEIRNSEKSAAELALINERAQAKLTEIQRNGAEERTQINIDEIEFQIMTWDRIGADERNSFEKRAEAMTTAAERRMAILDHELTNNLISFTEYSERMKEIQSDLSASLSALSDQMFANQQDVIATLTADAMTDLENELARGEVSLTEYYRRRADIQANGERASLENQLKYLEELAANMAAAGYDVTNLERQIAETRLKLAETTNAELLAREEQLQQSLTELRTVGIETAAAFFDASIEREQMALDERLVKLQERREIELELAGENEEAKQAITEKFAEEEKKIEAEKAKLARRKAVFDKVNAIFTIGVNTAMAISSAVAAFPITGGLPFSAIAAAIGALQIAAVLARPIPQYADGTEYHPGGAAIFAEAGPEIVQHPDGSMTYHDKPTFAELDRGSKVFNAERTERMINANGLMGLAAEQYVADNDRLGGVVDAMVFDMGPVIHAVHSLEDTVRNKKEFHLNITREGVRKMVRDQTSWTEYFNQNYF